MSPEEYTETLMFGLQLAGIGMGVVYVALVAITLLISNFDRVDHWLHGTKAEETPAGKETPAIKDALIPGAAPNGLTPEVMAAISAAVNEVVSKKVRITRIRYRQRPASTWQVQGRATIMNRRHE